MIPAASDTLEEQVGQVADEFIDRLHRGESPTVEEYAAAHPTLAAVLRGVLPFLGGSDVPPAASVDNPPIPDRLGEFRVVREVGRGGMGVVYEAVQEPLGRRVVLKVLPAAAQLQPGYLERFRREAQAAARLHHTNIVPVFGVGEADGVRYYTMQFIDGMGLDKAHPSRRVGFAEVARWGLQAAEALAYAHQQGVLHRDVKPANLLLDAAGTVWVTDFGLAKLAGGDDLTRTGDFLGTLRYAAPECLSGPADDRSDVYSLGATLYELLTGRPAFDAAERDHLVRQIAETEPPRPRRLNASIPRDLETVVLKALAKEPGRRYQSAGDLADDLRRFLDGRPLTARRLSVVGQLARWCRRRPTVAGLLALSTTALVALLVVTLVGNARLSTALHDTRLADARARENLKDARAAVDQLLGRVGQFKLRGQPHLERVQRDLLEDAARFYERFLERNPEDPAVRTAAAVAFGRVGLARNGLGDVAAAADAHRRSAELFAGLADESPEERFVAVGLVEARSAVGLRLRDLDRLAEAEVECVAAMRAGERLVERWPADADAVFALAATRHNLAGLLVDTGRVRQAETTFRSSLLAKEQLAHDDPAARDSLSITLNNLGGLLLVTGRTDEAEALYRRAIGLRQQLADESPGDPAQRALLASSRRNLGYLLRQVGRPKDAVPENRAAVELTNRLSAEFPAVPWHRALLADRTERLADACADRCGAPPPAGDRTPSLAAFTKLVESHPAVPEFRHGQAQQHHNLALSLQSAGKLRDAEDHCRRAIAIHDGLIRNCPAAVDYRLDLGKHHNLMGVIHNAAGRKVDSERAYAEAIRLHERLVAECPELVEPLFNWVQSRRNQGLALLRLGRPAETEELYRSALADAERLVAQAPAITAHRDELIRCRVAWAEACAAAGRKTEAEASYRRAIADGEQAVADYPQLTQYRQCLDFLHAQLAEHLRGRSPSADEKK